ncbi:MAG: GAF domain-containing protein [Chloroflexota bacterium]
MQRIRRERWQYVAVAVTYAVTVYLVLELSLALALDALGLFAAVVLSAAAGSLAHRAATRLESARDRAERGSEDLALVGRLSASLSGPLTPGTVATQFLEGIQDLLAPTVVTTLLQYEETTETIRILARRGGSIDPRPGISYSVGALPAQMRRQLIGEHRTILVDDTASIPEWPAVVAEIPVLGSARSFAALPLVSRSRLIGALVLTDEQSRPFDRDQMQVLVLLGQYVAGALHNALSIAEADERADREAVVNRISQRIYSNLDPDEVVRAALEELGDELKVSRVLVTGASRGAMAVLHEWTAPGVEPVGVGYARGLPLSALAIRGGRTIAVRDARVDARLADPALGDRTLIDSGTFAAVATPIGLGGQLNGVLVLDQVGEPRSWTSQEVRLLETVARELRTALEAAQLLVARQRESERMLALHHASALVAAETDPGAVLAEILEAAGTLLGRGVAAVYRWDATAGVLRLAENVHAAPGTATVIRAGRGVGGRAFESQQPVIVNDYASWPDAEPANVAAGWTAALSVPLVRAGRRIGVLTVGATDARTEFQDDDARLLGLFGDQAVSALTTAETLAQQRRAVEELERLNAAKSDFVSIVSHEFRTPLTGIQGFSELIRDEDLAPAEVKEYAGDINKDAQRLNRMITEMLDLDRMESGRMTLHRERADVNALVTEAADRLRSSSSRHPITLNLDPDLPLVDLDRDKIDQVLLNLLSNAVKYSPDGGPIALTTRVEGDLVHVFVRDSGLGIPADSVEKVFERYSRLESGATRYIQGTGLGLPIARQIIEMHGGHAWVESTVGEGSVFQFTLPLVAVPDA